MTDVLEGPTPSRRRRAGGARTRVRTAAVTPLPPRKRFGVVLGSGGVLGAAWTAGALASLEAARGIDVRDAEVIIGTSAGSVLAGLLGCGIGTADLVAFQRGLPVSTFLPDFDPSTDVGGAVPRLPRPWAGNPGLVLRLLRDPRGLRPVTALSGLLPSGRGSLGRVGGLVEQAVAVAAADGSLTARDAGWAAHPATWVVAVDYGTGRRVVFGREGAPSARLSQAVVASCSIPGWFAPQRIGGRRYIDGGASSATSLDLLTDEGLDEVFVLAPLAGFGVGGSSNPVVQVERQVRRLVSRRLATDAARVRAAGTRVTMLAPCREDLRVMGINFMDATRRIEVLESAQLTAARFLTPTGGAAAPELSIAG
jgi:NTE family protein